jgi:hypothetical protein
MLNKRRKSKTELDTTYADNAEQTAKAIVNYLTPPSVSYADIINGSPSFPTSSPSQATASATEEPKYNETSPTTSPNTGDITYAEGTSGNVDATSGDESADISYTDTYAEFLKKQEEKIADAYQSQLNLIDAANQKAISEANTAYAHNISQYGARAEDLASAGLKDSGYSEYLDAQSYAANRAEIQAANAVKAKQQRLAEQTYKSDLATNEEKYATYKQSMYDKLFDGANTGENTGEYTKEQIENIGKGLGFTDAQLSVLTGAVDNRISSDTLYEIENDPNKSSLEYTKTEIDDLVTSGRLTKADGDKLWNDNNEAVYRQFNTVLTSGTSDDITNAISDIEKLKTAGSISQETYEKVQSLLNDSKDGFNYQYVSGKITASEYIEKMTSQGYGGDSNTLNSGWSVRGLGTGYTGDEIYLTLGSTQDGTAKEYRLIVGGTVADKDKEKILNKLATGDESIAPSIEGEDAFGNSHVNSEEKPGKVVLYDGKLYIYTASMNRWMALNSPKKDNGAIKNAVAQWIYLNSNKQ